MESNEIHSYADYKKTQEQILNEKIQEQKEGGPSTYTERTGVVSGRDMMDLVKGKVKEILKQTGTNPDGQTMAYSIIDVMAHHSVAGMYFDNLIEQLGSDAMTKDFDQFKSFANSLVPFMAGASSSSKRNISMFVDVIEKYIDTHPENAKQAALMMIELVSMLRK